MARTPKGTPTPTPIAVPRLVPELELDSAMPEVADAAVAVAAVALAVTVTVAAARAEALASWASRASLPGLNACPVFPNVKLESQQLGSVEA